jgi:hypothetical protein
VSKLRRLARPVYVHGFNDINALRGGLCPRPAFERRLQTALRLRSRLASAKIRRSKFFPNLRTSIWPPKKYRDVTEGINLGPPNFCKYMFGGNVEFQRVMKKKIWKSGFSEAPSGAHASYALDSGFCSRKAGMSRNLF